MDPSKEGGSLQREDGISMLVRRWSYGIIHPQDQDDEPPRGILSQMYSRIDLFCRDLLHNIVRSKARQTGSLPMPLYRLLNSVYTSFIIWGDDFKVESGTLDAALEGSQDLRQFTIEIMMRICGTLTKDLLPLMLQILEHDNDERYSDVSPALESKAKHVDEIREDASKHVQMSLDANGKSADENKSSTDVSDEATLEDVLETLKHGVEALVDLGPCLEEPIPDILVDEDPAPPPQITVDKDQVFFDGIKQKFPQCNDELAGALSRALYETTMRLQSERQAAGYGEQGSCQEETRAFNPTKIKYIYNDSGIGTSQRPPDSAYYTKTQAPTQYPGSATTGSTYAQTLSSYADADDGTVHTPFPSQPKHVRPGENFSCIACGRWVAKSKSERAWRRHLLEDLRPWICCQMSCDCARGPFRSQKDWVKHLQAQHELHPTWDDKNCPFCARSITSGRRDMIRHVERHLQQLSLAVLTAQPADEDDDADKESAHSDISLPPGGGEDTTSIYSVQQRHAGNESFKDHPLLRDVKQGDDGLWHCPWEGEGDCSHKPSVLRDDFEMFVNYHFTSLLCKSEDCEDAGQPFATQEILYLHEQKVHGMHKGGGQFLCTSPGCGRSRPGNGFQNEWVQIEHIKNVHENIPGLALPGSNTATKETRQGWGRNQRNTGVP